MMSWNPEQSITEQELQLVAKTGGIDEFTLRQLEDGWIVEVKTARSHENMFLATRRDRTRPRTFKNLTRMVDHIRDRYPTIGVGRKPMLLWFRDEEIDPQGDDEGADTTPVRTNRGGPRKG
jgi:hypothetical protein